MPHAKKGQIAVVGQKKIIHTLAPYRRATLLGAFWGVSGPVDNLWITLWISLWAGLWISLWITCGQLPAQMFSCG